MGDRNRFRIFSSVIAKNFPAVKLIADVAGGKGQLQTELRSRGFDVITYDKRKGRKDRSKMRYKYGFLGPHAIRDHDLLVGLHPDEATEIIISEAGKRRIPFALVPCCILPTVTGYSGPKEKQAWIAHLVRMAESLNFQTQIFKLNMRGKNIIIIGRPRMNRVYI